MEKSSMNIYKNIYLFLCSTEESQSNERVHDSNSFYILLTICFILALKPLLLTGAIFLFEINIRRHINV